MPVIKRYPNRKLYNTDAKQYITLEAIADLIRLGQEVQVVDYASGEDLTAVTLTQIIFELEKRRSGFLPQSLLTGLIQSGGETLTALRRSLASSLDLFHQVDEEIERRIQALVARGELEPEQGERLAEQLIAQGHRSRSAPRATEDEIDKLLKERGVLTRQDLQGIMEQIEALSAKLEGADEPPQEPPEQTEPA